MWVHEQGAWPWVAAIALVSVGAIGIAPTVQTPPRPAVPAVRLAAATSPTVVQPLAQHSNVLGALLTLDLRRFIIPPSVGQPFPTPEFPGPSPAPTDFASAIKNTYVGIEPWVHYGFQLAQYAVGWVPYVGWLAPQIDIFYHFGERIVRSLVFNSADWLWGPLPFVEGLRKIARDSWNALVQLGIDQWNFWLPPLPPFPFAAQQAQADLAAAETLAPADQQVAPRTVRPDPLRHILAALRRSLAGPDPVAPQKVDLQEVDRQEVDHVNEPALVDELRVATPVNPRDDLQVQADLPRTDATPTNPPAGTPNLSGVPPGITSPPLTPLGKPKPFGKKPKPALETSNPSPQPSNESVGASNSPVATSNGSVGTPNPPKNRFNGPKKHRLTGSPSRSTASSAPWREVDERVAVQPGGACARQRDRPRVRRVWKALAVGSAD